MSIKKIVECIVDGDNATLEEAVNEEISLKIVERIEEYKPEVANEMFGFGIKKDNFQDKLDNDYEIAKELRRNGKEVFFALSDTQLFDVLAKLKRAYRFSNRDIQTYNDSIYVSNMAFNKYLRKDLMRGSRRVPEEVANFLEDEFDTYNEDVVDEYTRTKGAVVGGLIAGPIGAAVGAATGRSRKAEAASRKVKLDAITKKIRQKYKVKIEKEEDPKKKEKLRMKRDKQIDNTMRKWKKKWAGYHPDAG
jgi:hypothetical protein